MSVANSTFVVFWGLEHSERSELCGMTKNTPLGRTKWARLKKTFSTEQNSSFHSSASPRRSNRQWNVNQTDVVGTRVLHDGRQPWLGGRCCSRNWCLAVFAPEMGQVLPNLTPGPLPFQWATGHITTAACLQVVACAIIFKIAAPTEQHHHQTQNLICARNSQFLAFKCYLNELKFPFSFSNRATSRWISLYFLFIKPQRYMFRLMTFEVLKLVNQFGLYLFPAWTSSS